MSFLTIILICYFVVAIIRKTKIPNEWLPIISGGLGLLLSLIVYVAVPSEVPDPSLSTTLIYGFFCGLAATGSNQVLKQMLMFIKNKYNIDIELPTVNIDHTKGDK